MSGAGSPAMPMNHFPGPQPLGLFHRPAAQRRHGAARRHVALLEQRLRRSRGDGHGAADQARLHGLDGGGTRAGAAADAARPAGALRLPAGLAQGDGKAGADQPLAAPGRFVPLVHDLIPATHPEYARPGVTRAHLPPRSPPSRAGRRHDRQFRGHRGRAAPTPRAAAAAPPPVLVAPLGVEPPDAAARALPTSPTSSSLGTIEPRKNHLLLLHLWRDLAERYGPATPRLRVDRQARLGERERRSTCSSAAPCCAASSPRPAACRTARSAALLRGARALLFPSFAEGYGLPLAEALSLGVPAICCDMPALREVGGDVPEYLDPLDGAAWRAAHPRLTRPDSRAREAQIKRLAHWRRPRWEGISQRGRRA